MEEPTRTPDSIEVWEVLRELDRLARAARVRFEAHSELAEGYGKQEDWVHADAERIKAAMHIGLATGYEEAARKLAALFGIIRPERPDGDDLDDDEGDLPIDTNDD
jgi:hypothetical protein